MYQEDCIRVLHNTKEFPMKQEMTHLHLFPTEFPKDQIAVVVAVIRGQGDYSKRDMLEAVWWVAGYGASLVPDNHPVEGVASISDEAAAAYLESSANTEGPGMTAIPWELILPILLKLIQRFLK
jgi:hypothetical protein